MTRIMQEEIDVLLKHRQCLCNIGMGRTLVFSDADFQGIDLSDRDLSNIRFLNANFKNANLSHTTLINTNFTGSDLTEEIKNLIASRK